ncbi:hypothetical protein ABW21_db0200350 [Orbilia brochopaga]|nr:hypothetical protein ABW21_db0200350 [Drechslerella brochopaga]
MQLEEIALQNAIQDALGDIQVDANQPIFQGVAQGQANNLATTGIQVNNNAGVLESSSSESSEESMANTGLQQNTQPIIPLTQQQREFLLPGLQSPGTTMRNRRTSMFESPALDFGMGGMNGGGMNLVDDTTSIQRFGIDLGEHQTAYPMTQNNYGRPEDLIEEETEDFDYQPASQNTAFSQAGPRMVDRTGGLGDIRLWEEAKDQERNDGLDEETY